MIKDYQKFLIPDANGKINLVAEVNWDEKNNETNECKVIRITIPKAGEAFIKKEDLNNILFSIGTAEEQRKMVPQTVTEVRRIRTVIKAQALKDIQKGEEIVLPVDLPIPVDEKEVIGEIIKK